MASDTRRLPRILCLHGGGSNARIFKAQCRSIRSHLSSFYNFIFAEGPFSSEPGPDVTSVYKEFGPFRRWLRSGSNHPEISAHDAVKSIEDSIRKAMSASDREGYCGEWVAVMGFSQGAKLAASLLFRQQVRSLHADQASGFPWPNFRFAVLMAGRGPIVALDPDLCLTSALVDASQIDLPSPPSLLDLLQQEHVLTMPTIHLHGLNDPGLPLHRQLLEDYCSEDAVLLEWEGAHRVPIKSQDVMLLTSAILDMDYKTKTYAD